MNKLLKYLLVGGAALLALLVVGVAVIVATFNPDTSKALLIDRVQQDWQRTLSIPGTPELSLWPKVGVKIGEVSLSERGGPAPFASARSAQVSLAVWPLLRQRVVVDRVQIDGLRATLVRLADGSSSIDDLTGKSPAEGPAAPASAGAAAAGGTALLAFDIAGLSVRDAAFTLDDRAAQRKLVLSGVEIETGRLAPGVASALRINGQLRSEPAALDLAIGLRGQLTLDPAQQRLALDDLALALNGRLAGQAGARLDLGGALVADFQGGRVALSKLVLDAAWPRAAGGPLQLKAQGQATALLDQQTLDATLGGTLDGSTFDARIGMPRFTPAAYRFDVTVDRLDLDRLGAVAAPAPAAVAAAPDAALDLSALAGLDAQGTLKVGTLKLGGMQATNLSAGLRAAGGRVAADPVAANLYQGRLAGSVALDARAVPQLALRQTLTDVQLGPLLRDALGRDSLEGRGAVSLDVSAQGRTVLALRQSLAGSATAALRDGAVRGINVAQVIRSAKASLGGGAGEQAGAGSRTEKTDFSEMTASFRIQRGVARNDDLLAKSPLLRITGSGDIDLGAQRLDYLVKAAVVASLQGQGGPELQALKGQTVPVRLTGPFDAIGWRIDFAGLAKEAVKAKVEARKEEVKDKLREQLGKQLKGLFGK